MSAPDSIELVVTDLDGTLWGADESVHVRTLEALRLLEERDLPVLVATGRRRGSAQRTLARAGLSLPAVVLDGALGYDGGSGRVFHRAAFTAEQATAVLARFAAAGLTPCLHVDRPGTEVVTGPDPSTDPRHLDSIGPALERGDPAAVAEREPVLAFTVVGPSAAAFDGLAAAIAGTDGSVAVTRNVVFGGVTLTVRPPGISKWDGVLAWCAAEGLDAGRVLAVGDGQNDVELLSAAAVACAISDGCAEALALAHHVLDPPADGGWSAVLDLLNPGGAATDGRAGSPQRPAAGPGDR